MTLLAPSRLWLLLLVAGLAGLYLWLGRRRRHRAVRFTNLALLRSVAPRRPGWRRHLPAALTAVAMAALIVGLAGPVRQVRVPKEAATVMLVLDMSASMQALDVSPSRYEAAVSAAKTFVSDLPDQVRVGLVSFDRLPQVVASPTVDHDAVLDGLDQLVVGPGTAAGDALYAALDAIAAAEDAAGIAPSPDEEQQHPGAAIVLLSDGVTTVGSPVLAAARQAAEEGVPVSTIAFGTGSGTVRVQGEIIPVPADPDTMAQVAELTSGKSFEAFTADDLRTVYEDIGTRVGFEITQRDASGGLLAAGAVALAGAFGLGLAWNGRLI
ncbi:MAG: VWA domain-containing protein [Actinomycetota bacterium]|nr:VWA domain-containing protein [Actinomycetota bacterium]